MEYCIIVVSVLFNKYYSVLNSSKMSFKWQFIFREETTLKT